MMYKTNQFNDDNIYIFIKKIRWDDENRYLFIYIHIINK